MRRIYLTEEERRERRREYCRRWYAKNREKVLAEDKVYQQLNKERISARVKAYRRNNHEKVLARDKASRERRKDKIKAYNKEYRKRPEVKAKQKIRLAKYRKSEKNRIAQKKWRDKNKDKIKEYKKRFEQRWIERNGLPFTECIRQYRRQHRINKDIKCREDAAYYAHIRARQRKCKALSRIRARKVYHPKFSIRIPDFCRKGEVDFIQSPEPLKYGVWDAVHRGHKWTRDGR